MSDDPQELRNAYVRALIRTSNQEVVVGGMKIRATTLPLPDRCLGIIADEQRPQDAVYLMEQTND